MHDRIFHIGAWLEIEMDDGAHFSGVLTSFDADCSEPYLILNETFGFPISSIRRLEGNDFVLTLKESNASS